MPEEPNTVRVPTSILRIHRATHSRRCGRCGLLRCVRWWAATPAFSHLRAGGFSTLSGDERALVGDGGGACGDAAHLERAAAAGPALAASTVRVPRTGAASGPRPRLAMAAAALRFADTRACCNCATAGFAQEGPRTSLMPTTALVAAGWLWYFASPSAIAAIG